MSKTGKDQRGKKKSKPGRNGGGSNLCEGQKNNSQSKSSGNYFLAAGEGFELSEGDFRQYQLILSNAAIHWKHCVFSQSSFHYMSKGFSQFHRDKGKNKGQSRAVFTRIQPCFSLCVGFLKTNYPKLSIRAKIKTAKNPSPRNMSHCEAHFVKMHLNLRHVST